MVSPSRFKGNMFVLYEPVFWYFVVWLN